jgi:hypothetical protein
LLRIVAIVAFCGAALGFGRATAMAVAPLWSIIFYVATVLAIAGLFVAIVGKPR